MPAPSRGARLCVAAAPSDCIDANRCAVRPRGAVDLGRAEGQRCSKAGVVRNVGKLRAASDATRWPVLDGTGRSRAAQGRARSAAPQRARHSLCNRHTRAGVRLFRPRRAHREMREMLGLPSALEAPRYGQLTRLVTRQACGKRAALASAKSAITAPIPATAPSPPGVDNDLPYLSLRTGRRSRHDGSRCLIPWTRHARIHRGHHRTWRPSVDRPWPGRRRPVFRAVHRHPPGTDAIQGGVSGDSIAS